MFQLTYSLVFFLYLQILLGGRTRGRKGAATPDSTGTRVKALLSLITSPWALTFPSILLASQCKHLQLLEVPGN